MLLLKKQQHVSVGGKMEISFQEPCNRRTLGANFAGASPNPPPPNPQAPVSDQPPARRRSPWSNLHGSPRRNAAAEFAARRLTVLGVLKGGGSYYGSG